MDVTYLCWTSLFRHQVESRNKRTITTIKTSLLVSSNSVLSRRKKKRPDVWGILSKHFMTTFYQPNIPFSNKSLPTKPTCLNTEDRVVWFVSMEPPNTTILYFKMILSLLMERMATNCVEYWVNSFVGIKLDPGRNAYGLAWFYLKNEAKYKNSTLKHTFQSPRPRERYCLFRSCWEVQNRKKHTK